MSMAIMKETTFLGVIPLSDDQHFRGRNARIAYKGFVLVRGVGPLGFKGARWTVYSPDAAPRGVTRTFKDAQRVVDAITQ